MDAQRRLATQPGHTAKCLLRERSSEKQPFRINVSAHRPRAFCAVLVELLVMRWAFRDLPILFKTRFDIGYGDPMVFGTRPNGTVRRRKTRVSKAATVNPECIRPFNKPTMLLQATQDSLHLHPVLPGPANPLSSLIWPKSSAKNPMSLADVQSGALLQEHRADIDAGFLTNVVIVLVEPFSRSPPPDVM